MDLRGKTVLITGSARRVGRQLALAAADAGANIIIHYTHSRKAAEETAMEISTRGNKVWAIQCDLSQPNAAEALMEEAAGYSVVHALVNNAAIFENLSFQNTTPHDWEEHLRINLTAPFILSQAYARLLPADEQGKIINILDWRALRPGADHFAYTISKSALAAMTRSTALALAPHITVNGLAFGAILPPADGGGEHALDQVPLQRWADMEEVNQAFLFLLSGPAYMTGEILHLDGGRHLV